MMRRKTSWKLNRYPKITLPCIGLLLDQINEPCILIDLIQDEVVQVNGELLRITGFSNNEICFTQPSGLIQNYHEINLLQNEFQIHLKRKSKDTLHIFAKVIPLDNEGKWLLLELLLSGSKPEIKLKILPNLINAICDEKDRGKNEFINRIVKVLNERIEAHQLVVYQKNTGTNIYSLFSETNSGFLFPKTYESDDLGPINYPITWFPGNRVMNGFQRLARINKFSYLMICPICSKDELISLLIIFSNSLDDPPFELDVWISISNVIGKIQSLLEKEQYFINEKKYF